MGYELHERHSNKNNQSKKRANNKHKSHSGRFYTESTGTRNITPEKKLSNAFYKNWWFWTIVALVVTNIITLSVVINNKKSTSAEETTNTLSTSSSENLTVEEIFNDWISLVPKVNADNYNEDNYSFYNYKDLLRKSKQSLGVKIKLINVDVIQIIQEGNMMQYLVTTQDSNNYMVLIESRRLETKILKDDRLNIDGQFLTSYSYTTVSNTTQEVPLIYINAYALLNE